MPNYVSFTSAGGSATLDNTDITGFTAIEVHFQTTYKKYQPILSAISYGYMGQNGYFCLYLKEGNQIGARYWHYRTENATASWTPSVTLTDGEWHQIAVRLENGQLTFYVDGVPQTLDKKLQTQPFSLPIEVGGNIVLGNFNWDQGSDLNGSFLGNITEVRVWNNRQNFVPTPFAPVGPDAAGLVNYWPFWSNYGSRAKNLDVATAVSKPTPATLKNCTLAYSASQIFYDPWNEAVLNAPLQAFPSLNDGLQRLAVHDLLNQLAKNGTIQAAEADLTAFRTKLYPNPVKITPSTLPSAIDHATPNTPNGSDAALYANAFNTVKEQLLKEIHTLQSVYEYANLATQFANSYYNNVSTALANAYSANVAPQTASVSVDLDTGLEISKALMEFLLCAVAAPVPALAGEGALTNGNGNEDEEVEPGETGSAAMALIFALMRFAIPKDDSASILYEMNKRLIGTCATLRTSVISTYNDYVGNVNSTAVAIAKDWGKLSLLHDHSDDFAFPFYPPTRQLLDGVLQANEIAFCKSILPTQYARWELVDVPGNAMKDIHFNGADILDPYLSTFKNEGGHWNFYTIANFNRDPNVNGFTSAPSRELVDFLKKRSVTTDDLLWRWPFAQNIYQQKM
ncbi:LamG-like jellyroll fold domain-containing protein [Azospirillum soli]|uniref:LamG-like jellyroll fold domain-containing protein n=1 Tax=Azospirillum soli TaxID=1304799 RepID=UPI001AE6E15F|nr:LamG-like jellyroll fold domain-containing protein [Azospirillum soli]MBP2313866.1 hypothetical protein [Azospirillum soli]